eukprot:5240673-Karenia_brevis.AAC.1
MEPFQFGHKRSSSLGASPGRSLAEGSGSSSHPTYGKRATTKRHFLRSDPYYLPVPDPPSPAPADLLTDSKGPQALLGGSLPLQADTGQ